LKIEKSEEFKSLEDEVRFLREANMYWKAYSDSLGKDLPEAQKKIELMLSEIVREKEQ